MYVLRRFVLLRSRHLVPSDVEKNGPIGHHFENPCQDTVTGGPHFAGHPVVGEPLHKFRLQVRRSLLGLPIPTNALLGHDELLPADGDATVRTHLQILVLKLV